MKVTLLRTGWLASSLVLAFTNAGTAQLLQVGGPLRPGHGRPPLHVDGSPNSVKGYSPGQIRHAYGVDQLPVTGSGQTIGIVDAYGSPSLLQDLSTFCAYYNLPSTTVNIIYPQGQPSGADSPWAIETSLDVEWAHADRTRRPHRCVGGQIG